MFGFIPLDKEAEEAREGMEEMSRLYRDKGEKLYLDEDEAERSPAE